MELKIGDVYYYSDLANYEILKISGNKVVVRWNDGHVVVFPISHVGSDKDILATDLEKSLIGIET